MTFHLPDMVQTLQDKVAWRTFSRIKTVIKNPAERGTKRKFISSLNILATELKLDKTYIYIFIYIYISFF